MTSAAILQRTADVESLIEQIRDDIFYETNPRASAVAQLFVQRLLGVGVDDTGTDVAAIPLAALVTPEQLPQWQAFFQDPEQMAQARERMKSVGMLIPRVHPKPDGSVVVLVVDTHPEATEPAWVARQSVLAIEVRLRLVEDPDDWRVFSVS